MFCIILLPIISYNVIRQMLEDERDRFHVYAEQQRAQLQSVYEHNERYQLHMAAICILVLITTI